MKDKHLRKLLVSERSTGTAKLKSLLVTRDGIDREIKEVREYLERVEALLSSWDEPKAKPRAAPPSFFAPPIFKDKEERHNRYEGLSIASAASEVLKGAGVPLHAKRILAAVVMGGKVISSKTPLISVTSTLIRDDRFENIGGNTWRIKQSVKDEDGDGDGMS